jgi:hypothetical protein
MEPTDLRDRHHAPERGRLHLSRPWRVVCERLMRARDVVVTEVGVQESTEMRLVQDEEVVEALPADGADEPFPEGIRPGRVGGDPNLSNAHVRDAQGEHLVVDGISIAQEIPRRRVVRERLEELSSGPDGRRMVRDVEVDEFAAVHAGG